MNTKTCYRLLLPVCMAIGALIALALAFSTHTVRAQGGIFVDKRLGRADPLVYVGEYITFTIFIRNDTSFTVATLPLSDTFNAAVLRYADALPPPNSVDQGTGRLDWNDLTASFGDMAPGDSITVIVGFIAEHPSRQWSTRPRCMMHWAVAANRSAAAAPVSPTPPSAAAAR